MFVAQSCKLTKESVFVYKQFQIAQNKMNKSESDFSVSVIDAPQMRRIEAVHRGFLYQNLYAVGCILLLASQSKGLVAVERDEDVELLLENEIVFIQIKTRKKLLQHSDIDSTLLRFDGLRSHYQESHPDKIVRFGIVANTEAAPKLCKDVASKKWPPDVQLIVPSSSTSLHEIAPPAWPSSNDAILWCIDVARSLPFATLSPETLVWKLAARMQYASSGEDNERRGHQFSRSELPDLFEQLVVQLQDFPNAPVDYRTLANEPRLHDDNHVRLIVGFSGAGKTSWASTYAMHSSAITAYFDAGSLPSSAIASSLSRELAAIFISGSGQNAAQIPASSGLEALQALNSYLNTDEPPIVVLDNAHRVELEDLRSIILACPNVHFTLLAQPWKNQGHLEALFDITAEVLSGWDKNTVAEVFAASGAKISPKAASLILKFTGGLPLYVKNAASLCVKYYDGNAESFANAVHVRDHTTELAQEAILRSVVEGLSSEESRALSALSLASIQLTMDQVKIYLMALTDFVENPSAVLRSLQRQGLVQVYRNGSLKLHDALRLPASELLNNLSKEQKNSLQVSLRDLLFSKLLDNKDLVSLSAWLRLLAPTGQIETLVDIATTEIFHERGDSSDLKLVLVATINDDSIEPSLKFWALDALAYWEFQEDQHARDPLQYMKQMEVLLDTKEGFGDKEKLALAMKQMLVAGLDKKQKELRTAFEQANNLAKNDAELNRILRYNFATALFQCEEYQTALSIAEALYSEYYDVVGLCVSQVIGASHNALLNFFEGRYEDQLDNLKHLADSLNLAAMCKRACGQHPRLAAIHAAKFYKLSSSYRSEMKAAQDVADDFISCGDAIGARQVIEQHVLPLLNYFGFEASTMDVRGQYAVILAYCGEFRSARAEMSKLSPYITELVPEYQAGFFNQCSMIDDIEAGLIKLKPMSIGQSHSNQSQFFRPRKKVGRNDPCPCGSGIKYKKCCLT